MHPPFLIRDCVMSIAGIAVLAMGRGPVPSTSPRSTHVVVSSPQGLVAAFRFDPNSSTLMRETSRVSILSKTGSGDPLEIAFLAATADGTRLYAAGRPLASNASKVLAIDSCIVTLSFDPATGSLAELGRVASGGERPTHVALSRDEKYVLAANNESNSVSIFPRREGGLLGEPTQTLTTGVGAHQTVLDSSGRFVFVPNRGVPIDVGKGSREPQDDLPGSNTISQFVLAAGVLTRNIPPAVTIGKGINSRQNPHPRHMVFHPNGKWAYVCNALNDTVAQLSIDSAGLLSELQSQWFVPEERRNKPLLPYKADPAEISLDPAGKFLYVSSGAGSSIAIFAVDPHDGGLSNRGYVSSGGEHPRHFVLDPTGSWLVIGNDKSNTLVLFRVDPATGNLKYTKSLGFPEPWCQIFVGGEQ
jgi:6-phosphogluconolactonase